jgi:DNA polymerase III subunit alpha
LFEQHRPWLREDQLLIVEGKASFDNFSQSMRLTAERLYDLAAARNRFARGVRLHCNGQSSGQKLKDLLSPYRNGTVPVCVVYTNGEARAEIELGDAWKVKLDDNLIAMLGQWLEPGNIEIVYQ